MSFSPIETQEAFDAAISERIGRLTAKHADELHNVQTALDAANAELTALRAECEKHVKTISDFSGIEEKNAALTAEISSLRNAAVRRDVAEKYNLPKELAERLVGEDEASLAADAERLANFLNTSTVTRMPLASEDVTPAAEKDNRAAYLEMLAQLKN